MAAPTRPDRNRPATGSADPAGAGAVPAARAAARPKPSAASAPAAAGPLEVVLSGVLLARDVDYVSALQRLEAERIIQVRAAVDASAAQPSEFATPFPGAERRGSLDNVTAAPGGLVLLATPPRLHPAQIGAAVRRGWHVFSVTPLAATARDATAVIALAARHERTVAIDLHRRFYASVQFLRTLCRDQLLGPLFRFSVHEGTPRRETAPAGTIPPKAESPDGVLMDLGPRAIDVLAWCLGQPSVLSYADDAMGGAEANAVVELAFADGIRGTIHLSEAWPTAESAQFVFERGIVRWSVAHANRLIVQLASAPAALDAGLVQPLGVEDEVTAPAPLPPRAEALAAQLRHLVAALAGRETLRVGADEALKTLSVIDDCYAHRTLLDQPWLSHNEAARARSLSSPAVLRRP